MRIPHEKREDLSGQRFNKLLVMHPIFIDGGMKWLCQCDCGNETVLSAPVLITGNTSSCGCYQLERIKAGRERDRLEPNTRFGQLMVLETQKRIKGHINYLCKCDCGKEIYVWKRALLIGNTKSCGCGKSELISQRVSKIIPIGTKYNFLTIISGPIRKGKKRKRLCYSCICDCGQKTIVEGCRLREGSTQSCGCYGKEQRRKGTTTHGLSYTREYQSDNEKRRRELEVGLDYNWSLEMSQELLSLQPKCILCESEQNLQIDHVLPLIRGFGLEPGNAVVLCRSCNSSKKDRLLSQLKPEIAEKIQDAAKAFEAYWEDLN